MKLFVLVLATTMFFGSIATAGSRLTREQFDLIHQSAEELNDIAKRITAISDGLKTIENEHSHQTEEVPLPKEEPLPKGPQTRNIMLVTSPSWCAPCRRIEGESLPELKKKKWVIKKYFEDGNANIWIIDRDSLPGIAVKFDGGDPSVPQWVLMVNGKPHRRHSGFLTASEIVDFFKQE